MSETKRSASSLVCPECGGEFTLSDFMDGDDYVTCTNCNKKYFKDDILHKSTEERVEEIRSKAYRGAEEERTKAYREVEAEKTHAYKEMEAERIQAYREAEAQRTRAYAERTRIYEKTEKSRRKAEKDRIKDEKQKKVKDELDFEASRFKKSLKSKLLFLISLVAIVMAIVAFSTNNTISGIIAVTIVTLAVVGRRIGRNKIPVRTVEMSKTIVAFVFLAFIPLFVFYSRSYNTPVQEVQTFEWGEVVLGTTLPQPETNKGIIVTNSDQEVSIKLNNCSENDFYKYKQACINFGYSERSKNGSTSYFAANNWGYRLTLSYYSYSDELHVDLEIPDPSIQLFWDDFVIGHVIPTSDLMYGRVIVNSDEQLHIYLSEANAGAMNAYIAKCRDAGFTVDASQSATQFDAYNSNGYKINLHYNDENAEISVTLYDPVKRNILNWATVSLMDPLPTPPSNVGEFSTNFDWTASVYILDVTKEDYETYVDECIKKGFTKDQSRYENSFWGENKNGFEIHISWEGNNTMYISVTNFKYL